MSPTANINQSRFWEQAFHCPPIHYHICPNGTFCILFHSRYQSHIRQFPPPSRCWALVTTGHGTFATPMRYAGKKEKVSQTRLYLHSPGKHRMIPISPALFFNSWTFIFRTFKPKFPEWFLLTCLRHQPGKMKMSHGRWGTLKWAKNLQSSEGNFPWQRTIWGHIRPGVVTSMATVNCQLPLKCPSPLWWQNTNPHENLPAFVPKA